MGAIDVPMLDRIVINVIDVPAEIIVVAYDVIPEAALPNAALVASPSRGAAARFIAAGGEVRARKRRLDGRPAQAEQIVSRRHRPDRMDVVRHDDDRVDREWMIRDDASKRGAQQIDRGRIIEDRPASFGDDREEHGSAGGVQTAVFGHDEIIQDWCVKTHPTLLLAILTDCNENGIQDVQDIANCDPNNPACQDCNENNVPDGCDISCGTSQDANENGIPDECEQ